MSFLRLNIFLILLLILCWAGKVLAVPDGAGNDIFMTNVGVGTTSPQGAMVVTNGNVGIGTWVPGMILDVVGSARATAFSGNGAALTGVTSNGWTAGTGVVYSTTGSNNIGIGTTTPQGGLVVTNGNVGIGTWAPNRQLSIVQSGSFASLGLTRTGQREYDLLVGNSQAASFEVYDNSGGGSRLLIDSNGNVGIGTTAPQGALTVMNGNVGIGTWAPAGALVVMNGNVGIGTAPQGPLHVTTSAVEALRIQSTGPNVSLNGYDSGGLTEFLESAGGAIYIGGNSPQPIYLRNNNYNIRLAIAYGSGNVGIGPGVSTSSNVFSVAGNVGIGTVSSSAFFHNSAPSGGMIVEGDVGIGTVTPQGGLVVTNGNVGIGTWAPGGALIVQNGNVGIGTNTPQTGLAVTNGGVGIGTWTTSAGTGLSVMNGNVGIGTIAQNALSIYTPGGQGLTLKGPSGESFSIFDDSGGGSYYYGINPGTSNNQPITFWNASNGSTTALAIGNNGGNNNYISIYNNDVYAGFQTTNGEPITFQPYGAGNVGIGTWAAFNVLTVVGNVGIGTGINSAYVSSTAPTGGMIVEGNVGIGTTTPQAKLAIVGGNVGIGTWSAAGGNLIINGGGNVGIGSAWPGQMLDVQGSMRVTGLTVTGQTPVAGYVLTATDNNGDTSWSPNTAGGGWTTTGSNTYTSASSANVGIGTATPQAALVVTDGNVGIGTWSTVNTLDLNGNAAVGSYAGINAAPAQGLIVSGSLGIGTFAPSGILQVGSYATGNGIRPTYTGSIVIPANGTFSPSTPVNTGIEFIGNTVGSGSGIRMVTDDLLNGSVPLLIQSRNNSTSWTNVMSIGANNAGNVGIGTFGALSTLVVSGNEAIGSAYVANTAPANGLIVQGNVGVGTITPQAGFVVTNGNVGIGTWTAAGGALMVQGGNVGIGTWNTLAPLDLASSAGNQLVLSFGGLSQHLTFNQSSTSVFSIANSGSLIFTMNGASNYFNFATVPSAGNALDRFKIDSAGNVGVGSWNSNNLQNTFDVVGNIGIGTGQSSSFLQTSAPNGGMIVQGNVGIGSVNPGQMLDVTGTVRMIGLTVSGQTPVAGYVLTATDNNGDATWSPNPAGGGWTQVGSNTYTTALSSNVGIGTTTPQGGLVVINGDVGIGTFVPNAILDIGPNTSITEDVGVAGSRAMFGYDANGPGINGNLAINAGTGEGIEFYVGGTNGTFLSGTEAEYISSVGNIGLGTTTPQGGLVVTNGNVGIGTWAPAAALVVMNGNVGVGTSTASYPLQVTSASGTSAYFSSTASSNGGILINNGTTGQQSNVQFADAGTTKYTIGKQTDNSFFMNDASLSRDFFRYTTGSNVVLQPVSGNVGVGSTNPGQLLDVNGSIRVTSTNPLYFGSDNTASIQASAATSGDMRFLTNNNEYMRVTSVGTVGVGTSTPNALLDVRGNIYFGPTSNGTGGNQQRLTSDGSGASLRFQSPSNIIIQPNSGAGKTTFSATNVCEDGSNFCVGSSNVGIGTWISSNLLSVAGGGIGVGATISSAYVALASAPAGGIIAEGNVGIGTTNPQAALVITRGNVGIGTWTAAGGNLIINGGGNVGIGSAWPQAELDLGTSSTPLAMPGIKSTTGTRYLCINTNGVVISSASACSGT